MAKNTEQDDARPTSPVEVPPPPPATFTPQQRADGDRVTLTHTDKDGKTHELTTSHRGEIAQLKAMGYRTKR